MTSPYYQYGMELDGGVTPHFYIGTAGGLTGASMGSAARPRANGATWRSCSTGTQAQFYVNGNLVASPPLSASITARDSLLYIGADQSPTQFFNGTLDDVRLYNRAQSQAEVMADMNEA